MILLRGYQVLDLYRLSIVKIPGTNLRALRLLSNNVEDMHFGGLLSISFYAIQ